MFCFLLTRYISDEFDPEISERVCFFDGFNPRWYVFWHIFKQKSPFGSQFWSLFSETVSSLPFLFTLVSTHGWHTPVSLKQKWEGGRGEVGHSMSRNVPLDEPIFENQIYSLPSFYLTRKVIAPFSNLKSLFAPISYYKNCISPRGVGRPCEPCYLTRENFY